MTCGRAGATLGPPGGTIDRDPKIPTGEAGWSPRDSRAGLCALDAQGGITPVPSRDTSRDMPGWGRWLGHPVTRPSPGSDPGNSSRRLKSALPRLGGLAQLPGRDPAAAPVSPAR